MTARTDLLQACKAAKLAITKWCDDEANADEFPHAMALLVKAIQAAETAEGFEGQLDLYVTTQEMLAMGIRRHCWACGHEFWVGDRVSLAITVSGNKALCHDCADMWLIAEAKALKGETGGDSDDIGIANRG